MSINCLVISNHEIIVPAIMSVRCLCVLVFLFPLQYALASGKSCFCLLLHNYTFSIIILINPYSTELVFQISSHFQHWRLYCIYFGHHSLSLPQIKCSALPFLTGTGANKMTPLHVGTSYIYDFRFYSKGNASGTHQSVWAGSLKPQFAWVVRGHSSL